MDHNMISVGGVAISDFKQLSETMGVFRFKGTTRLNRNNPLYIDVKCFGRQCEICCEYVMRGTQINIVGRLDLREREYEGKKIQDYCIIASNVEFSNPSRILNKGEPS